MQGAEEFRGAKRQRPEGDQEAGQADGRKKQRGVAFGTGAAEETDTYGYMEDYVTHDGQSRVGNFNFEIASDEEDSDLPLARSAIQATVPHCFCVCYREIFHDRRGDDMIGPRDRHILVYEGRGRKGGKGIASFEFTVRL